MLVIDDNLTHRLVISETLVRWGLKPTLVPSGATALVEVQRAIEKAVPYRLILLDATMPEMDGFQTTMKLRGNPRFDGTIIMMLGSAAPQQDAERCLAIAVSLYLVKPLKIRALQEILLNAAAPAGEARMDQPKDEHEAKPIPRYILLVEDNPVNQQLAIRLLQKMGHTVVLACDGQEALQALAKKHFDLVLMDVQMPEMDGFAATAAIRTRETVTGAHIPIVAMTARAMKGDRERCLETGMDDYISKPVHQKELEGVIERNVSAGRQAKGTAAASHPAG